MSRHPVDGCTKIAQIDQSVVSARPYWVAGADLSQDTLSRLVPLMTSEACEPARPDWTERRARGKTQAASLLRVGRLVAVMSIMLGLVWVLLMLMRELVVVGLLEMGGAAVVAVGSRPLALPPARLFLVDARAEPPPVLFVPGAQRFAAKHEVVVFDDGGHHPRVAVGQVHLVDG